MDDRMTSDAVAPAIAAVVARRWPGARVTALAHVAGDFSARRYLRARTTDGDPLGFDMVVRESECPRAFVEGPP